MSRIALRPPPSRYRLRRYARQTDFSWITRLAPSRLPSILKTDPTHDAALRLPGRDPRADPAVSGTAPHRSLHPPRGWRSGLLPAGAGGPWGSSVPDLEIPDDGRGRGPDRALPHRERRSPGDADGSLAAALETR